MYYLVVLMLVSFTEASGRILRPHFMGRMAVGHTSNGDTYKRTGGGD